MDHITTRFGVFLNHYSKCRLRKQLITFEALEAYSNKFPCKIKENDEKKNDDDDDNQMDRLMQCSSSLPEWHAN